MSLASKKFDGQLFPGNTQAIAGHYFIEGEVFPRRTPAAACGSAQQLVNENNLFLPFSCSGDNSSAHTAYGDQLEYPGSDDDDAWSSVEGQYTDQSPQSVTVQPDEQCDMMSHSERVILARTFLCDELPTDKPLPRANHSDLLQYLAPERTCTLR